MVEAQGENSIGAKTLATELNNQEAMVKRVQKELQEYTNRLANGITKKTNLAVKSMTDLAKATVSPFS